MGANLANSSEDLLSKLSQRKMAMKQYEPLKTLGTEFDTILAGHLEDPVSTGDE